MLELFMLQTCPYCRKVLNTIETLGRTDIEFRDIQESYEDRKRLIEVGGKEQVPCLFIDGSPLYESLDIIHWLEEHPQA